MKSSYVSLPAITVVFLLISGSGPCGDNRPSTQVSEKLNSGTQPIGTTDLNEIYLSLEQLHSTYAPGDSLINLEFAAATHKDKIIADGDHARQLLFLRSFHEWFSPAFAINYELAEKFLESPNQDLKELAAVIIVEYLTHGASGPVSIIVNGTDKTSVVRGILRTAFQNKNSHVRAQALRNACKLSSRMLSDEEAIIGLIDDDQVGELAKNEAIKFPVAERHLAGIAGKMPAFSLRGQLRAIALLTHIHSDASLELLFRAFTHPSDGAIEIAAKMALESRSFAGNEDIFGGYLNDRYSDATKDKAIKILEHIGSAKASSIISHYRHPAATPPSVKVIDVFVSDNHKCAIIDETRPDHANLFCWGENQWGQAGLPGSQAMVPHPNPILGKNNKPIHWISGSAGAKSTCMIEKSANALYCVGKGSLLGFASGSNAHQPLHAVDPGSGWLQVSVGEIGACAIRTDGTLWCWGGNPWTKDMGINIKPQMVSTEQWDSIALDRKNERACAIKKKDKSLNCWGPFPGWYSPGPFVQVQMGSALMGDGVLIQFDDKGRRGLPQCCWESISDTGKNFCGVESAKIGNGGTLQCFENQPPRVKGLKGWKKVAVGIAHDCGIDRENQLWCWEHVANGAPSPVVPSPIRVVW